MSIGSAKAVSLSHELVFAFTQVAQYQYDVYYAIQDKVNSWLSQKKQKSNGLKATQKKS
jgi:hypothetical protein